MKLDKETEDLRLSKGYSPQFDIDLKVGQAGEHTALGLLDGIEMGTVEVKRDDKAAKTGNIYVEYECRGKPSGIETTKADAWCYVLGGSTAFFVPTDVLRFVYNALKKEKKFCKEMNRGSNPSKGVIIPIEKLLPLCLKAIEVQKENN